MMRWNLWVLLIGIPVLPNLAQADIWLDRTHDCPATSITDALHLDADGTLWVGCGTNGSGFGLFYSTNQGADWAAASTAPEIGIDSWRVTAIHRGYDGALYVGGTATAQGDNTVVLRLVTSAEPPFAVSPVLVKAPFIGYSFTVGNYRDLSDGRALADSLTGSDRLFRPSAEVSQSALDWEIPAPSHPQFLDLVSFNDAFYAAGSLIAQGPRVFLPPLQPEAHPASLVEVILDSQQSGLISGLAVNEQRIVGTGINNQTNRGVIYVSGSDPYDADTWTRHDLSSLANLGDGLSWGQGACMRGAMVVVVGERQPLVDGGGLAVLSIDGGQSFHNISPASGPRSISRCVIDEQGAVVVAGSGSYLGLWTGFSVIDPIFQSRFEALEVE